jgi:hypothetical protein
MKNHDESNCANLLPGFLLFTSKLVQKTAFPGKAVLLVLVLLLSRSSTRAQTPYSVYTNIIYRFTKYINWPNDKKAGDFVIGVIGDTPLYDELAEFTSHKTVGNQRIVVKKFSPAATSFNCHILFVTDEESNCMKRVADRTTGMPVLLVSESDGLIHRGSCINFIIIDDHLKLEISKSNIERRKLDVATELLSLGVK